jgi:Holliday junction resolvase-like predicted endonuclease
MFVCMGPRQQGDLGELSAMGWLVEHGYALYLPLGHSPDVDVIAEKDGRLHRVQVKTSRSSSQPGRWQVAICTRGGNQSWNGIVKHFSPDRCDYLFVLVADGRRWFIPSAHVGGRTGIVLGAPKYQPFEVSRGTAFT